VCGGSPEAENEDKHLESRTQQPEKTIRHLEDFRWIRLPRNREIASRSELAQRLDLSVSLRHYPDSISCFHHVLSEHPMANVTIGKASGITQTKTEQKHCDYRFFLSPSIFVSEAASIWDYCCVRSGVFPGNCPQELRDAMEKQGKSLIPKVFSIRLAP